MIVAEVGSTRSWHRADREAKYTLWVQALVRRATIAHCRPTLKDAPLLENGSLVSPAQ